MGHAQRQNHLVFPQRDGVDDGGLNFLRHHGVVGLDEANLRAHLDGDVAGQLEIIQLFLEPVAQIGQIAGGLRVLRQLGAGGLLLSGFQLGFTHLRQFFLAGQNIHGQLLEVHQIQLIHFVQHGDVLHEHHLMVLQLGLDALHVFVGAVVAGLEGLQIGLLLFEEPENAALLFLGGVKALQFVDEVGDELAGLAHVLGANLGKGGVGKFAQLFLAGGAVLQHHLAVGDVDFFRKIVHHLLLFGGEGGVLHHDGSGFLRLLHHLFVGGRVQRQRGCGGGGVQRQAGGGGSVQIKIGHDRFLTFLYLVKFWLFRMLSSTSMSVEMSMASALYKASSWFSKAVAMVSALRRTSLRIWLALSPLTPPFSICT